MLAIFDITFTRLITRHVIGVAYVIALVLILVSGLIALAAALFTTEGAARLLALVIVPIVTLLQILVARVIAEAVVVYFRIAEDVQALRVSSGSSALG